MGVKKLDAFVAWFVLLAPQVLDVFHVKLSFCTIYTAKARKTE